MTKPPPLSPSDLGTKEYWETLYSAELSNHAHDPSDTGTAWFDDSDAENKLVEFLSEAERQQDLSLSEEETTFLDLGTGNGQLLFALRDAGWRGEMLGVDYSRMSVDFARKLERGRRREADAERENEEEVDVRFHVHDILRDSPFALHKEPVAPESVARNGGWDVVLDKGTFDAVSLCAETLPPTTTPTDSLNGAEEERQPRRVNELYPPTILALLKPGGLFLVTSCNWTEDELRSWFAEPSYTESEIARVVGGGGQGREDAQTKTETETCWGFDVVGRVPYRSFSFGGAKGQTISSLCFRKMALRDR
ncbi:S-adenosyl-L-methionine-dependent methyltransferase [Xylariaceae sp. FL1272]|nr:S-adenosyl-L-methionine-dependent methyltransferase [Xylariaceae sp. FL1272]